ncbi:MAG: guanosine-3',5'-bis(diphosphate) 3'-diphosphatase, partial [Gammaproteobacteria bacterium]
MVANAKLTVEAELTEIHDSEPKLGIDDLCLAATNYLEAAQVDSIRRAYHFAEQAHEGQVRRSGEPYITHPLAVAHVLAMMHMDYECITAGLLHDVIEDTEVSREQLAAAFSEDIALLVDGVTKLALVTFKTRQHQQAENLRKMLLAMSKDIRVIIVKLADRLHNMRTLGHLPAEKRHRIAHETLDLYAPIAQRLGMNLMRCELEDLGFHVLYPLRYRAISNAVKRARGNRKEILSQITASIQQRMEQEGLSADIQGREKNLYSLYQKMVNKHLPFSEVMDVYAYRIVVDDVASCYRMLGVFHNLYKPVQGKFKDYIAIPKANGYQSLHTVLFGPYGVPIEMQIRSRDMDQMAEAGVASHWLYKTGSDEGSNLAQRRAKQWLQGVLEMQKDSGDSVEFLENLRIDLFP